MHTDQEERRRAFEQFASKRGYDLERNGHPYANHVTNDLWTFYEAGCRQQSPVQEAGPWFVSLGRNKEPVLQSDDFEHDVQLRINGDFASPEVRTAYAEELARRLNRICSQTLQPGGDVPYEETRAYVTALANVLHQLGLEEHRGLMHRPAEAVEKVTGVLANRELQRLRYYRVLCLVMEELGVQDRLGLLARPETAMEQVRTFLSTRPG